MREDSPPNPLSTFACCYRRGRDTCDNVLIFFVDFVPLSTAQAQNEQAANDSSPVRTRGLGIIYW
jgi:hypothetical protein